VKLYSMAKSLNSSSCRLDNPISWAFCFGGFGMECICMSMPCKCVYALKSSLLFYGNMLLAWRIKRSCMLSMDLLLWVFSLDGLSNILECFSSYVDVIVIDSWHVLRFGGKLSGCISTPPRDKIDICVCFQRDHHIYIYLF
jgi:hypothetical protein